LEVATSLLSEDAFKLAYKWSIQFDLKVVDLGKPFNACLELQE
jgi:hypothetical protein